MITPTGVRTGSPAPAFHRSVAAAKLWLYRGDPHPYVPSPLAHGDSQ